MSRLLNWISSDGGRDVAPTGHQRWLSLPKTAPPRRSRPTSTSRSSAAGFAGLGMAIKLKQAGPRRTSSCSSGPTTSAAPGRPNTYPGCQCDVPSNLYSFSFAPNPDWSQTFALQPEIWRLPAQGRRRLRPPAPRAARLRAASTPAGTSDARQLADRDLAGHASRRASSSPRMGGLSEPSIPEIPGAETLRGRRLPHRPLGPRRRPARASASPSIGTGASAVQVVPRIQPQVARLSVFQRTPPWIMPAPRPAGPPARAARSSALLPALQRAPCAAPSTGAARRFVLAVQVPPPQPASRERMARTHLEQQVADPALRAQADAATTRSAASGSCCPTSTSRRCSSRTPSSSPTRSPEVRPHGVVTADGVEHAVDAIVWGTGFRVTDMPLGERLRGRGGRLLGDVWREQRAAGAARHDRRRLPEPLPARRAEHRPRAQLDRLHDRVAARVRDGRAAGDGRRGAPAVARHAPRGAGRLQRRRCSGACGGPSGPTAAAPAGTSTRTAATRRCGPAPPGASGMPRRRFNLAEHLLIRPAGSACRCRARRRSTSSPGPSPCRCAPSRAAGW